MMRFVVFFCANRFRTSRVYRYPSAERTVLVVDLCDESIDAGAGVA